MPLHPITKFTSLDSVHYKFQSCTFTCFSKIFYEHFDTFKQQYLGNRARGKNKHAKALTEYMKGIPKDV